MRNLSAILREAADRLERQDGGSGAGAVSNANSGGSSSTNAGVDSPVISEVRRLFQPYSVRSPRTSFAPRRRSAVMAHSSYTHTFCCLASCSQAVVPSRCEKEQLARAGLGEKRLHFQGNENSSEELSVSVLETFPKLASCGGFELMRVIGASRSRDLVVLPCIGTGYTTRFLRSPEAAVGQAILYVRPLQEDIALEVHDEPAGGPLVQCLRCNTMVQFEMMRAHMATCRQGSSGSTDMEEAGGSGMVIHNTAERRQESSGSTDAEEAGGSGMARRNTAERRQESTGSTDAEEAGGSGMARRNTAERRQESTGSTAADEAGGSTPNTADTDWKTTEDPFNASALYRDMIMKEHEKELTLQITLDLRDCPASRDRALLRFYKKPSTWAGPLHCVLLGDAAVGDGVNRHVLSMAMDRVQHGFHLNLENTAKTLLFEGEPGHLVPSTARSLLDNDLFKVAGRIIGHCFIHSGPKFAPAILHALVGNPLETATVTLQDCADVDIRTVIEMLEGSATLTAEQQSEVTTLALSWDLPGPTSTNRRWLMEKLLIHAMILDVISWPGDNNDDDDDDDEDCDLETKCQMASFLRTFIVTSSSQQLINLIKFWSGWEVLPRELIVVVSQDVTYPVSATCFDTLKLPGHYMDYDQFAKELTAVIGTWEHGFGLI
ncbi:uncharacterized protein LOC134089117 isoform X2 [Sardina pilchardus]|uniref:uncharacterized protein LOC134089117 isoform X2 n=1 Tax=Sardina pilchardus TaxID=27697 RepID=UPI002E14B7A8